MAAGTSADGAKDGSLAAPKYLYQYPVSVPAARQYIQPDYLDPSIERPFTCPAPGCPAAYPSSTGLYQHKRSYHPELIKSRGGSDTYTYCTEVERRFECDLCDKAYGSSQGLYQHKRAKHPWLIKERARGYKRPEISKKRRLVLSNGS